MTDPGANVKSNEAIEAFRIRLLVYLSKVRPLLEDAQDEVFRSREWLRTDRVNFWRGELTRRQRALEQAQQALFAARFSDLRETSSAEMVAVERAKRSVTAAEDKLRAIKRWTLEFDHRVLPLLKHFEQLTTTLANDLPKGAEYLRQIVQRIDEYVEAANPHPLGQIDSLPVDSTSPIATEPVENPSIDANIAQEAP